MTWRLNPLAFGLCLVLAIQPVARTAMSQDSRSENANSTNPGGSSPGSDGESQSLNKPTLGSQISSVIEMSNPLNVPLKTAGGAQFWTDFRDRDGFRVQQNSFTSHWRLLDPNNVRLAWGSREHCLSKLGEVRPSPPTPSDIRAAADAPAKHQTFVLLHGLMRTRDCMKSLGERLETEFLPDDGVTPVPESIRVIRFSYSSTRRSIGENAAALQEVLGDLPNDTQINFVGHSMGNIVVRHLVGDLQRNGDPNRILDRCRCMVMLGPPNQGASIARRLAPTKLYGFITGKGGLELGPGWSAFSSKLATPPFPFLIIAGDVSDRAVRNPLVDGDGDFVVSLEEAKLDGSAGMETFPVLHSFLMGERTVCDRTIDFLSSVR